MKEIDKEALKANKVLSIKDVEADLKEIEKFNWRNNINYKLKDFVTDEMLIECGFSFVETASWNGGYYIRCHSGFGCIFIEDECGNNNVITGGDGFLDYIKDLIEKGYVEALK